MKNFIKCVLILTFAVAVSYGILNVNGCSVSFGGDKDFDIPTQPKKMRTNSLYCKYERQECHYMFSNNIEDISTYTELLMFLHTASESTTVYLHVVGHGGVSLSASLINNAIKTTKATVVTIIEGPVYSAHAIIALSGHKLEVKDGTLFMFHRPAYSKSMEDICYNAKGKKDRGQDLYKKCILYLTFSLQVSTGNSINIVKHVLTEEELFKIQQGHDVYITGEEMKRRINK